MLRADASARAISDRGAPLGEPCLCRGVLPVLPDWRCSITGARAIYTSLPVARFTFTESNSVLAVPGTTPPGKSAKWKSICTCWVSMRMLR